MSQAASPVQAPPISGSDEMALIRLDGHTNGYRRLPRSDARLVDEGDAEIAIDMVAIDAPRDSVQARRLAAQRRPAAAESATPAEAIVAPHQTYALMSAGLLSMALVIVRRRRH